MPVHDWTRVKAGIFHHFHSRWIGTVCDRLNLDLLPKGFYALLERHTTERWEEDLPSLPLADEFPVPGDDDREARISGQTRVVVVIRRSSDDRAVAVLEIDPPFRGETRKPEKTACCLTVSSIYAGDPPIVISEVSHVGTSWHDLQLYVADGVEINVPLETTYAEAYGSVPERWRAVIEGRAG